MKVNISMKYRNYFEQITLINIVGDVTKKLVSYFKAINLLKWLKPFIRNILLNIGSWK